MIDVEEDAGGAFEEILRFVEDELSFATSHYNDSYLRRRVTSRMRRTKHPRYAAYLELLRSSEEEQVELLDALSINVTGFFRNPDVWDGIRAILRELSSTQESIDVWSAACADGREPYSVMMIAHDDPGIDASAVNVLGTDISEPALETARSGRYRRSRTVDVEEQLEYLSSYESYVDCREDAFYIRDHIREDVTFQRHDLINDDPKSDFDLVICRNLFIYIDDSYKREILDTLSASIRPDGYLVIGKAETIPPTIDSSFEALNGRKRIYHHRPPVAGESD